MTRKARPKVIQDEIPLLLDGGDLVHPLACQCEGSGTLTVPDPGGEGAHQTACTAYGQPEQHRPAA